MQTVYGKEGLIYLQFLTFKLSYYFVLKNLKIMMIKQLAISKKLFRHWQCKTLLSQRIFRTPAFLNKLSYTLLCHPSCLFFISYLSHLYLRTSLELLAVLSLAFLLREKIKVTLITFIHVSRLIESQDNVMMIINIFMAAKMCFSCTN